MEMMTFSTGLFVAASAGSSVAPIMQGIEAKKQAKAAEEAEKQEGRAEELERLRKLRTVQAALRASVGAAEGSLSSGSVIAQEDDNAQAARIAQFNSDYMRRVRESQLRARGRNALTQGAIGGGAELLQSAASYFDIRSRMV